MLKILLSYLMVSILVPASLLAASDDGDNDRIPPLAQLSNKEQAKGAEKKRTANAKTPSATNAKQPFSEAKVLKFVGEHQPELLKLLEFMKKKQPAQYQQALREMARSQQRLETLAEKDKELHTVELELWNIRSRLRLVAAQIPVVREKQRGELEKELKDLVERELQQNRAKLTLQKERLETQVKKLSDQIARIENDPEKLINNSLKNWQNRISKQAPRTGRSSKRSENTAPPKKNP